MGERERGREGGIYGEESKEKRNTWLCDLNALGQVNSFPHRSFGSVRLYVSLSFREPGLSFGVTSKICSARFPFSFGME